MIYQKFKQLIFGLALVAGCSIYAGAAQAPARPLYDPSRIPWMALSFQAKNFWVKVSTNIRLVSLPAAEIEALLLPSPKGNPIKPKTPQLYQMTINTLIDPIFRSPVSIYNRIWFNPTDASALGRIRLRRGEDDFKKVYRFTDRGVFRHLLEPKDKKEAALDPEKWSRIKDSFYPYDLTRLGCAGATERSLPIYIISAADISDVNDSLALCIFGKRQLHRMKFKREGTYPLTVNFIEKTKQNEIRKEEQINAIKIAIAAEPMESDLEEPEDFSFLGLHKDLAIYIDSATHIPVQISGTIPTVGQADLKLDKVLLKN